MITELRAPKTGMTAENVEIMQWHKKEKECVEKEEIILTIETEKVSYEIESPRTGYLVRILAAEGDTVPVGQVIARIGDSPDERSE